MQTELHDYDRRKLEIADLIRAAMHGPTADSRDQQPFRELLAQLAEDQFNLAVIGEFNRGKSSLMNALLGMDRLPTGVVPVTSAITSVRYGSSERVLVRYDGNALPEEVPLDRLRAYVSEDGNPGNQKGVRSAEVQLPAEILRRGFFFIDTPGLGSAIVQNTATTEQFLPQVDAAIFVTSFDRPLAGEELGYLQLVLRHVRKLFLVINKQDLVTEPERRQVLEFVEAKLAAELGGAPSRLYSVSARNALGGKLSGDNRGLAESGLSELEEDLVRFLTVEKARHFLARVCDRALELLAALPALGETSEALRRARAGLLKTVESSSVRPSAGEGPREAETAFMAQPCPVCTRVVGRMFDYLSRAQLELSRDAGASARHAAQGGFCTLHTWQYAQVASPQGICTAYPPVLARLAEQLQTASQAAPRELRQQVRNAQPGRDRCPACRFQAEAEDAAIREVLAGWSAAGPSRAPVFCLPHLEAALHAVQEPAQAREMLLAEVRALRRLAEDMRHYALKHEAVRRGLVTGEESRAHTLGLMQLVGHKQLRAPWGFERFI